MTQQLNVIVGCGDVGRRLVTYLQSTHLKECNDDSILAIVRSAESVEKCQQLGVKVSQYDFDQAALSKATPSKETPSKATFSKKMSTTPFSNAHLYYLVPPNQACNEGKRGDNFISVLKEVAIQPRKVVLISTTGVYGDCDGAWVTEQSAVNPQTARGKRRVQLEQQWQAYSTSYDVPLVILRVPGIYANSRIPYQRLQAGTPVVDPAECGYSNRIHADDLAMMMYQAMTSAEGGSVYNATDGTPGKISEYLQQAARIAGLPELPVISLQQAQSQLSKGMLSYLGESRKISNQKILDDLQIELQYPDYKVGLTV